MNLRLSIATAALLASSTAAAYETSTSEGCNPALFPSPPHVVLHTGEAIGLDLFSLIMLTDAMIDVHERLGAVGASSAAIASFTVTGDPFVFGQWFYDPEPTIHVGFTTTPRVVDGEEISAWAALNPDTSCETQEAHIAFMDVSVHPWAFLTPSVYGEDYYDVEPSTGDGLKYFRPTYMHELLHTFGLDHSDSSFSFMNGGEGYTWANRAQSAMVQPLPDDVEALRDLYPASGTRYDVAVYNTWYDTSSIWDPTAVHPAAYQKPLCYPSLGADWGPTFGEELSPSTHCGVDPNGSYMPLPGSTTVEAGDVLRTRVAVANFGTKAATISERMYFSTDDVFDAADVASPTVRAFELGHSSSTLQGRVFTVPSLPAGDYYVIAHVTATTPTGATGPFGQPLMTIDTDWVPLRGLVTVP